MTPDQINALIQQLLETGQILASKTFELAVRQVYLKAGLDMFFGALFVVLTIVLFNLAKAAHLRYESNYRDHDDVTRWLAGAGSVFCLLVGLINLAYVVSYLVNPQWYAISLLISNFVE